jgi:hypothetical protein
MDFTMVDKTHTAEQKAKIGAEFAKCSALLVQVLLR